MRKFDALDPSSFKAFWAASETLNFTSAAKQAGLTQSGVSQHISRLEKQLGAPLFERVNKRVFLTEAGKTLRSYVEEYLDQVEQLKERVQTQALALTGSVSYSMPSSCLMSPHLGLLLKKRKKEFPGIKLQVDISANEGVVEKVMNGNVQFGFVTKKLNYPGLNLKPYCTEKYILIGADKNVLKNISEKNLSLSSFVDHPGADVFFEQWRQFHFPKLRNLFWSDLDMKGAVNSLAGAIAMVEGGLGLTVIPEHCVQEQLRAGTIAKYMASDGKEISSTIYFVTREGAHLPRRAQKVMETFQEIVH